MADLQGRKVFKVFNQEFIVDERYNVTKELGQGAYGIVWYTLQNCPQGTKGPWLTMSLQRRHKPTDERGGCNQEGHQCLQQEDSRQARAQRDQVVTALQRYGLGRDCSLRWKQLSGQKLTVTAGHRNVSPRLYIPCPLCAAGPGVNRTAADNVPLRHGYPETRQLQRVLPIRRWERGSRFT